MIARSERLHFVGLAGAGVSALAQLRALEGHSVTGSDRLADKQGLGDTGRRLAAAGIRVVPQDGSGVEPKTARVVVSTAIEGGNPDLERAAALEVPVVHRADELASIANARKTVAVAGTSGKSTVTGMVFQILETAGLSPSLVTGAGLSSIRERGLLGNAWLGSSDLLAIEADESDGTIDRYKPHVGLLLNVSKDHKGVDELMQLFEGFKSRSAEFVVSADAEGLDGLRKGAATYGFKAGDLRAASLELAPHSSTFELERVRFTIPLPGRHNAENALAAVAACRPLGVTAKQAAEALASFKGVSRRFELVGKGRGVAVYDDYAHNPDKVRAAMAAGRLQGGRLLIVFQLHGFAPARFLKDEFVAMFAKELGRGDVLWLPDIYYAGGTAAKDISAREYADRVAAHGKDARHAPDREALPALIAAEAESGDVVLVLGARDPSLSALARAVAAALK